MALLLPNLRQLVKLSSGIREAAARAAVQSIETWADEMVRRLSKLEASTGGGVSLPIAESDVTNLVADLAAKAPTSRLLSGTSPIRIDAGASGNLSADRTISVLDNSTANKGVVAVAPNDTSKFWRGDASWAAALSGLFAPSMSSVPTASSTGFTSWWYQPTGATVGDGEQGPWLKNPNTAGTNKWAARVKAAPGTPYTVTFLLAGQSANATGNSAGIYVGWSEAATGAANKAQVWYYRPQQSETGVVTLTNATTVSVITTISSTNRTEQLQWVKIADNGTTVSVSISANGDPDTFQTSWSQLKSTGFLGSSGYSYLLFGCVGTSNDSVVQILSYKQA